MDSYRHTLSHTTMNATTIAVAGTLSEITIPKKTSDVLEWIRKKYKQPGYQFQGKIVNEDVSYSVFALPTEDEDEHTNQHMLPNPFHDDSFQGVILLLKSKTNSTDEYEKPASAYMDMPSAEYDEYYASCTFDDDEDEDLGLFSNVLIDNPILDSIDPDGAAERFPELARDPRFWFDMVLFITFLDLLSTIGPQNTFPDIPFYV